jgi:hypothetical protein
MKKRGAAYLVGGLEAKKRQVEDLALLPERAFAAARPDILLAGRKGVSI